MQELTVDKLGVSIANRMTRSASRRASVSPRRCDRHSQTRDEIAVVLATATHN